MVKQIMVKAEDAELPKIRRSEMDEEKMEALVHSVESLGLIQPILVRRKGDKFEVVVGTRRLLASRMAGQKEIPAILRDLDDREALEAMLIENLHREDLTAVDKGRIIEELMNRFSEKYPSTQAIADMLKVVQSTVVSWIKLAKAPKEIRELIAPEGISRRIPKGKIDWRTAYYIIAKVEEPKAIAMAKEIAKRGLSRGATIKIIKKMLKEPERPVEEIAKEVAEAPPEIIFRAEFKEPMLKGVKVQTARTGLPKGIKKGAIVYAHFTEPRAFKLKITDIYKKRLGDFDEEDAKREGGYTLEEFKEVWERLMEEKWNPDAKVFVIQFEVLGD